MPTLIALRQDVLSWYNGVETIWNQRRIPFRAPYFKGQTDTEIAVHLIGKFVEEDGMSVLEVFKKPFILYPWILRLCSWFRRFWGHLRCKNKSPLLVGLGEGYNMVCSDAMAMIRETNLWKSGRLRAIRKDSEVQDYDNPRTRSILLS